MIDKNQVLWTSSDEFEIKGFLDMNFNVHQEHE